jgi:hypothetical protein
MGENHEEKHPVYDVQPGLLVYLPIRMGNRSIAGFRNVPGQSFSCSNIEILFLPEYAFYRIFINQIISPNLPDKSLSLAKKVGNILSIFLTESCVQFIRSYCRFERTTGSVKHHVELLWQFHFFCAQMKQPLFFISFFYSIESLFKNRL